MKRISLFLLLWFLPLSVAFAVGGVNSGSGTSGNDPTKVPLAGGTMTGDLTVNASATVSGNTNLTGKLNMTGGWNVADVALDPTGFENRTDSTLSFASNTRTLTITGNHNIWVKGVKYAKTTASIVIGTATDTHYVYYNSAGTLASSTTAWTIADGNVSIASIYWDGVGYILGDERHGISIPKTVHKYLHTTVGARFETGLTMTADNAGATFTAGAIWDEDIQHSIGATGSVRVLYRAGSNFVVRAPASGKYFPEVADVLQYDNSGTLTDVTDGYYVAVWLVATNDHEAPIWAIMGQTQSPTIQAARAVNTFGALSFGDFALPEIKSLYRIILRRAGTAETYMESDDYRNVMQLPATNFVPTDHGSLSGLDDDDHPQYALLAASNTFAADQLLTNDTSSNSYSLKLKSVNGATAQYHGIQGIFGADPYLRLYTASATDGSIFAVLDMHGTKTVPTYDAFVDLGGTTNRFKDLFLSGTASAAYFQGDGSLLTNLPTQTISGNEYRLAAAAASEAIYLNGTGLSIAVASGSAVRFEVDFVAVASDTDTKWGGKVEGLAIASGAIAYLAGSAVTDTWPLDPGALGISAGISGGNLGIYASGTAGSLWKAVRVNYWTLEDEP